MLYRRFPSRQRPHTSQNLYVACLERESLRIRKKHDGPAHRGRGHRAHVGVTMREAWLSLFDNLDFALHCHGCEAGNCRGGFMEGEGAFLLPRLEDGAHLDEVALIAELD
jgi:hypothetical protein